MTLDFQRNILKYLFQYKTKYLEFLDLELFELGSDKALFEMYRGYINKYKSLPDRVNFMEYVKSFPQLTTDAIKLIQNSLSDVYKPIKDVTIIEYTILEEVKKAMFKNLLIESMKCMESGLKSEDIENAYKKIQKIRSLKDDDILDDGLFLIRDMMKTRPSVDTMVLPTFLQGLNDMTTAGGFHSPQTITLMGPPKSFKTGFLIEFTKGFLELGQDVMYCDFENGHWDIHQRFKQHLLRATVQDLQLMTDRLDKIKYTMIDKQSGEVYIKKFQKKKDHFGHIETSLNRLITEEGLEPKVMIYDYMGIMGCSDPKIKETRLKLQHNYADADYINNKYGTFCINVAKMKPNSWKKEWVGPEDVAEDTEIIYNSHAVWAIMRNEEDIRDGLGRIIPIAQRQGDSYVKKACIVEIDPKIAMIKELE